MVSSSHKENILDLLDCVNAWILLYGYENMRPEMKELASKLSEAIEV